jgi:hypothetical protein
MDWNGLLQTLLYAVITAGLPVLLVYGISLLKAKRDEKLQNIDNEYVKNIIIDATNIVLGVVDTVGQTYVDDLKKEGKFDTEKQKEALNKALSQAKNLMNDEMVTLVVDKYNDLDTWIRTQIESYIKNSK